METPINVIFDYTPTRVNEELIKFKDATNYKCYVSHEQASNVQGLTCIKQLKVKDKNKYAEIRIYQLTDDDIRQYEENDIYHYLFNPTG